MRQLATIRQVKELLPIEGKDRIELAIIDGWQVIVQKGLYTVGDLVIYVEIDSILPEKPEFEFMRKHGFRVRTMKMAGVVSQGICFPVSTLSHSVTLGEDVTQELGITKYEAFVETAQPEGKPAAYTGIKAFLMRYSLYRKLFVPKKEYKGFPTFIAKTDEPRIQNMPHMADSEEWMTVREKVDGQSGTFFLKKLKKTFPWQKQKYDFGVCSRNLRLWNEDNSSQWFVAKKYNIREVLEQLIGDNDFVAIQGECIAPKVQGNKYKVTEPDLYCFNLIYPSGRVNCLFGESMTAQHGLKWVPYIDTVILQHTVQELVKLADGMSAINPDVMREGLVFRNYKKGISFKVVSQKWLLGHGE